jgi:inorganic pyrophosphatase
VSETLKAGRKYLGKRVDVVVERPLGSLHPRAGFKYLLNYGFVPGTMAPDGSELDAYLIGLNVPVDHASGLCIAIVNRLYEDDATLVVTVDGIDRTDETLADLVLFQEGDRPYEIVRR